MQSDQVKLPQDNNQLGNLCAICGKIITKNDLVHILVEDTEDVVVHFKCFVEVHDKICCGENINHSSMQNIRLLIIELNF